MSPLKRIFMMLALTCCWSPSFLFIKYALQSLPPMTIVSLRVSIAAVILCLVLAWKGSRLPTGWGFWGRTTLMAVFSSILPFCLFCYAEQTIDSALAAILNGSTPMFTAVLAQLFVSSDRMDKQKVVGIVLCSLGVVLLFAPQLLEGVSGTTLGMAAATMAAFSYAISHVYGKLYTTGQKPFIAPAAQFIVSAAILWPLTLWHDQSWTLPMPSSLAIMGVCGLALFGTVLAFIIYYKLLDHCGPTAISLVACFFPVGGMFLGFVFLDETFTLSGMLASGMILFGMLTVNKAIPLDFFTRSRPSVALEKERVE